MARNSSNGHRRRNGSLYWDGDTGNGLAYYDGVHVELKSPPPLGGTDVTHLDYAPSSYAVHVREGDGAWREITAIELDHIEGLLTRMAAAARDVLEGKA